MAANTVRHNPTVPTSDGLRDTIESIVMAFILAFVFRAFVVEAFRIPTGSMAPTLLGEHGRVRCVNCAYPYPFNMRQSVAGGGFDTICPNCQQSNPIAASPSRPFVADGGDRILVLKWPYDLGGDFFGPTRWDVAVFKDPKDSQTNFIKRLVGLPNEVLEVTDGDIYSAPAESVPEAIREKLRGNGDEPLSPDERRRLDALLRIRRKSDIAQQSLWMLHYDHDYPSQAHEPGRPAWSAVGDAAGRWRTDEPRIRFDGGGGSDRESFIELTGRPIQDFYGYNTAGFPQYAREQPISVGDARVELVLVPRAAAGRVVVSLSKDGDSFSATIDASGRAGLTMRRARRPEYDEALADTRIAPLRTDAPVRVALQNVDYRVSLEIDGRTVLATKDSEYAPQPAAARKQERGMAGRPNDVPRAVVRIGAAAGPLELWHVRVLRDVYYRPAAPEFGYGGIPPGLARGTMGRPILLRGDEFYACGDNSPQSKDSRLWSRGEVSDYLQGRGDAYQVGTVPRDQLIGRAFFVYWPSGRRLTAAGGMPIVPDFGRMRVIR